MLQRCFGLYARVLVDVDLSKKMFESVVIESEGHALSIQIQYEKQPMFCANCKMIGHTLQTCMKLIASKIEGPSRHKGTAINTKKTPSDLSLRQQEKQPEIQSNKHELKGSIPHQTKQKASVMTPHQTAKHYESKTNKNRPMFDLLNVQNLTTHEGFNEVVIENAVNLKGSTPPPSLNLTNAFEILANADSDLPEGEALLPEKEPVHISSLILEPVELMSKEIDCLDHKDGLEAPSELKKKVLYS